MTDREITVDIIVADKHGVRHDVRASGFHTFDETMEHVSKTLRRIIDMEQVNIGHVTISMTRRWDDKPV